MNPRKSIGVFIAVTFSLGILLSLFIGLTGGHDSPFAGWGYASMLIPAFAVFVLSAVFKSSVPDLKWQIFPIAWLPVGLLPLPIILHTVLLPVYAYFGGNLSDLHLQPDVPLNMISGIVVVSVLAFFEEIGWRVWLLAKLISLMSVRRALCLMALLYALWHTPYDLSGIHYITGVKIPVQATLNVFGEFGAGLVFGWLWLRTRSIWIICLAHGAFNNCGQLAFKYLPNLPPGTGMDWLLAALNCTLFITGLAVLLLSKPDRLKAAYNKQ